MRTKNEGFSLEGYDHQAIVKAFDAALLAVAERTGYLRPATHQGPENGSEGLVLVGQHMDSQGRYSAVRADGTRAALPAADVTIH